MSRNRKLSMQIKPLLKLHDLRIKRLERQYQQKKSAYHQAVQVVEERKVSIENLKQKRAADFQYLQANSVRLDAHTQANTHRYWIEYDLEKDEYYLPMEEQEMRVAEDSMNSARKAWLQARNKKEAMQKKLDSTHLLINKENENSQELEIEEAILQ